MTIRTFVNPAHEGHHPPAEYLHGHAVPYYESPERVRILLDALTEARLIAPEPAERIAPQVLHASHDPAMVRFLQDLSQGSQELIGQDFDVYDLRQRLSTDEYYYETMFPAQLGRWSTRTRTVYFFDSTSPVGRHTWEAALGSASAAYAGASALLAGDRQAYALCRPPGHHAGRNTMGGYCYLNNAAVAANHLKGRGRVAILDVDYHHGNGTQDIFWEDDEVLFVSLHADPALDYPYFTGFEAENHATNRNIPLPHGTTAPDYLAALDGALAHIREQAPGSLVVSLGFDIHRDDPMGHFDMDTSIFAAIAERIVALHLPTLYVQEGGYRLAGLDEMAATFFQAVLATEGV